MVVEWTEDIVIIIIIIISLLLLFLYLFWLQMGFCPVAAILQ
jgi:hypothetical protein